ncbi:S1 family peptidase [Patescibacteria group bacterium]|nr:S1 family peptidase [Patescibacteria group bacterium]
MSERVRGLKEKYEEYLLGVKGVTGVAIDGSIIILVEKLTPELRNVLPKTLDGVPVRIKETGPITLMSFGAVPMRAVYADRTSKYRPAPGGISVGHPLVTAGTLTCRALDKVTEKVFGLSNDHVIALDWGELHVGKVGDSVLQPGPSDGGVDPDDKLGELLRWIPVKTDGNNLIDAAIFSSEELRKDVLEIGNPSHTVEPRVGRNVVKSGRSSGVNYGKITGINATVQVDGGEGMGVCTFKNQIIIEPAILFPGDSGSWIGEVDTFNSVGLGFAGSDIVSIANPALIVEELLGIEIIPPVPALTLSSMLGMWLGSTSIFAAVYYGSG